MVTAGVESLEVVVAVVVEVVQTLVVEAELDVRVATAGLVEDVPEDVVQLVTMA